MDSLEVRPLPGTETTPNAPPFSGLPTAGSSRIPATGGKLKKVDLVGSPPQTLCDTIGQNAPGGAWNSDGVIMFGSGRGPLTRVAASGGATAPVTALERLPDGNPSRVPHVPARTGGASCTSAARRFAENSGVYIGSLDARPEEQDSRQLLATAFMPVYVPTVGFGAWPSVDLSRRNVLAYAFDEARKEIVGDPVTVVQQVGSFVASGFYSASLTGVLVYRSTRRRSKRAASMVDRARAPTRTTPNNPAASARWPSRPMATRAALVASGHRERDWRRLDVGHDGRQRHARDVRYAAGRVSGLDARRKPDRLRVESRGSAGICIGSARTSRRRRKPC